MKNAILFMVAILGLLGCNFGPGQDPGGIGGGPTVALQTIHMPFADGTSWRCTQGAHGSYSHSYNSTRYDIDLDTPNPPAAAAEVYAPIGGTAYVHMNASGFGNHINIDIGNGTYVLLGHLSEVWVNNNVFVTEGELLGLAGCTGACTGDHVHLGVHQGDASADATNGTSIPSAVFALDTNTGDGPRSINMSDFVCGLSAGHFYKSFLAIEEVWDVVDDDDDTPPQPTDDDDDTEEPVEDSANDDDIDDDDDEAQGQAAHELCWQPDGLVNPHNGELWVQDGGWQTIASASGSFGVLCGTVWGEQGDALIVNGEFSASNVLSDPWWICSNWGSAGLVIHGSFFVNGLSADVYTMDNGVDGCDMRLFIP